MESAMDDRSIDQGRNHSTLIASLVIGFCLALGVIVWAGGFGLSNEQIASSDPATHPGSTSPAVQAPVRSTTGSAH
jgi:hypothetical protein